MWKTMLKSPSIYFNSCYMVQLKIAFGDSKLDFTQSGCMKIVFIEIFLFHLALLCDTVWRVVKKCELRHERELKLRAMCGLFCLAKIVRTMTFPMKYDLFATLFSNKVTVFSACLPNQRMLLYQLLSAHLISIGFL